MFAFVVVVLGGDDLGVVEAVGAIQVQDGVGVLLQQPWREAAPVIAHKLRRSHQQAIPDGGGIEIMVAGDLDVHQLAAQPAVDAVVDDGPVRPRLALLEFHFRLQVASGLEIFEQVALTLQQQAAVHGALLVDRNELAQAAGRDFGAGDVDLQLRSVVDAQAGRDTVGVLVITQALQSHVRRQMVALLHASLHLADAALKPLLGQTRAIPGKRMKSRPRRQPAVRPTVSGGRVTSPDRSIPSKRARAPGSIWK